MIEPALNGAVRRLRDLGRLVRRPHMLLLMPVLTVAAMALGGQSAMVFTALAFPVALAIAMPAGSNDPAAGVDALTGLGNRCSLVKGLDAALGRGESEGGATAALVIELDRFKLIEERHDRAAVERILRVTAQRIADGLRDSDTVARLDGPSFGIALSPVRRLDLESTIQLAGRIQRSIAEPIAVDGINVYVTGSIGFALAARMPVPTGEALLQAATLAMIEAQRAGPAALRSYTEAMRTRITQRNSVAEEVTAALERGQIMAFFQPQISVRTGAITGFESLARWNHPTRGLIPPSEFLPAMEQMGLMERLGETMIQSALSALRHWDGQGHDIPRVGVNFSNQELCDPRLVERLGWELDRFDLRPDRLVVEVLETVVADSKDDVIVRNLAALARLGCCLDLDDFGTGHTAIGNIRRFSIERIKIDRSFVTRIDEDVEQQRMVSAILTMSERLGLDTLAEGVETPGEQAMLARLGCGHVQGFGIARPMPMHETDAWITAYNARLQDPNPVQLRAI